MSASRARILGYEASHGSNVSHPNPAFLYLFCDTGGDSAASISSASRLCHEAGKESLQSWGMKEAWSLLLLHSPTQRHQNQFDCIYPLTVGLQVGLPWWSSG